MNKFYEIFRDLKQKIDQKEYPAGSLLPSELNLAQMYNVSRETIRKALNLLLESGYIQKQQGKGSIVLDIQRLQFPVSGLTSFKELQEGQQIDSQTIVIKNKTEKIPRYLAEQFHLPEDTDVVSLVRLRKISGEVIILDKDYLLHDIVDSVPTEAAEVSLYGYLEKECKLTIAYAKKEFVVEPITQEDQKYMNLKNDTHVVVVKSEVYLEDTRLFQYTESRHRLDRFKFVEFARRKHTLL
ncbi:trehalose operon repressor [Jeotgalibaca ciconiae]|uniref:Trehalose operon repressor n=1 Tax=Jeotgalibaca ciconiae TaxID=2496265 RepID=A0A3Q9BK66_9LACT|nr:trehalose operon repressor [Jeotgalibaca ciconiae]AZP04317.1 trehalose operon repressor [Jeotgalibaca ciconiae]